MSLRQTPSAPPSATSRPLRIPSPPLRRLRPSPPPSASFPQPQADDVNPAAPVSVAAFSGTIDDVKMVNDGGKTVPGALTPDRKGWHPTDQLGYGPHLHDDGRRPRPQRHAVASDVELHHPVARQPDRGLPRTPRRASRSSTATPTASAPSSSPTSTNRSPTRPPPRGTCTSPPTRRSPDRGTGSTTRTPTGGPRSTTRQALRST